MIFACSGRCSLISMPGTFVVIGLNSPRNSAGASGLRSYMSMWLGPPASQSRITDFASRLGAGRFRRAASLPQQIRQRQPAEAEGADSGGTSRARR